MTTRRFDDKLQRVMAETTESPVDVCRIDAPGSFGLVIFGASGDLTKRKLVPALYRLYESGLLPEEFFVLGLSDATWGDAEFRSAMLESTRAETGTAFNEELWGRFSTRLNYRHAIFSDPSIYQMLGRALVELEKSHQTGANRMFYLAIPPVVFETVVEGLGSAGFAAETKGFARVVVEKPFGHDLESARHLNAVLGRVFKESQVYRMDHYLAKENVQNILMFRFANSIFEPIWNRRYVDHVQITVSETLGVEQRAGYFEKAGILRDMFQNHIMQLVALTAIEPPSAFDADLVRDEKAKVFRSMRPMQLDRLGESLVIGQYTEGEIDGHPVAGYRQEPGVAPDSITPTFAAMKIHIDNWRWQGVPFYLRSGKRTMKRKAEIAVQFRSVPHMMFAKHFDESIVANTLVLRVQPDEGIALTFQTKTAGSRVCLSPVLMDFTYPKGYSLSGYERVLLDCLEGDQMLFVRDDSVMLNWALFTPVLEYLESEDRGRSLTFYKAGSECPREALTLMHRDGRVWRRP